MPTITKIKIIDNKEIRALIDELYDKAKQEQVAVWALILTKRILVLADIDYHTCEVIKEGFDINEQWQRGNAKVHDIRQAGFKVHKLAREQDNEVKKTALRVAGQAIATGHMKEHAMVASDYAIRTINLIDGNMDAVTSEREQQLSDLKRILGLV